MSERLLCAGTVIHSGKYRIYRRLGCGTFGEVYEAQRLPDELPFVAIKVATAEKYNQDVRKELEILRFLQDSGDGLVVRLHDSFELQVSGESRACIVLEKLDLSLHRILAKRRDGFFLSEVAVLGRKILHVLAYFQRHGLIHLDLKPGNVLVNLRDGQVRVADFGNACFVGQEMIRGTQTAAYRAPEVALGLVPYTYAADMWSFGCILAELYSRFRVGGRYAQLHELVRSFGLLPKDMLLRSHSSHLYNELRLLSEHTSDQQRCFSRIQEAYRLKTTDRSSELFPLFLDLLGRIFQFEPEHRLTVESALKHEFFEAALSHSQEVNYEQEVEPPWPVHLFAKSKGTGVVQRRPRRSSMRETKRTAESTPPSSGSSHHGSGSSRFSSESDHT